MRWRWVTILRLMTTTEPALRNHKPIQAVYISNMHYTRGFYCWPAHIIVDNIVAAEHVMMLLVPSRAQSHAVPCYTQPSDLSLCLLEVSVLQVSLPQFCTHFSFVPRVLPVLLIPSFDHSDIHSSSSVFPLTLHNCHTALLHIVHYCFRFHYSFQYLWSLWPCSYVWCPSSQIHHRNILLPPSWLGLHVSYMYHWSITSSDQNGLVSIFIGNWK